MKYQTSNKPHNRARARARARAHSITSPSCISALRPCSSYDRAREASSKQMDTMTAARARVLLHSPTGQKEAE